ncbi:P-II family nitrogen regulator [Thermosulfurimonas dismutans]|uniref:Nitrogen regulatory protein P-II n=1 Tax=Thermosulfurimonas dismutans TaxID=999894 RepID=A0A179D129_9BACT|nr:P-II family nitrogen regulator [Thermosulfurimonas dismutans]OAQ19767.1 Nitrogen regulatory protein P-II [Thermosulfurimonas dismutans]
MKSTGKIIWLGLCLVLCSVFWAQAVTITATGSGPTRQAAINNALRAAVEQAMGAYIQSNTRVVEGRLDYDRIISASAGYIRHYDVLAEGQDPIDQVYKVKVRVPSFTAFKVLGRGKQGGRLKELAYRVSPEVAEKLETSSYGFIPKRLLLVVVPEAMVPKVVERIIRVNQSGEHGDGKIFVLPMEGVFRVRTGEEGLEALF